MYLLAKEQEDERDARHRVRDVAGGGLQPADAERPVRQGHAGRGRADQHRARRSDRQVLSQARPASLLSALRGHFLHRPQGGSEIPNLALKGSSPLRCAVSCTKRTRSTLVRQKWRTLLGMY